MPLALAAAGAWLLLERGRLLAAGLLIGVVVAVKPNFLVWPGLLLLAGYPQVAFAAAGCAAVLSLAPAALYGPRVYGLWLDLLSQDAQRGVFLTNASLLGLFLRFGYGTTGLAASLALLAGLAFWARRHRPDPLRASALGLLGALLASPLAWIHYTLFPSAVLTASADPGAGGGGLPAGHSGADPARPVHIRSGMAAGYHRIGLCLGPSAPDGGPVAAGPVIVMEQG